MEELLMTRDGNLELTGAMPVPDTVDAAVLSTDTEKQIAIPDGVRVVKFSATADFFMAMDNDGAISVPGSHIEDGSSPELNPDMRLCSDKTTIHLIAGGSCTVTLSYFS